MRVESAELKARLSYYLRKLRENGEPIEVLIRDEPVAVLTSIDSRSSTRDPRETEELRELANAFSAVGLTLAPGNARRGALPELTPPATAGDGREDVVSVAALRGEKEW
ncbi:MAG TPA: type II toxin-antitoxin system prevent-host-death family antitoxin [Verrucomicrobiales bacterium]|nr:type II toxin-antitoxin system prevent-host-death family antitoxin [Verrucomicrobiales bacterium]